MSASPPTPAPHALRALAGQPGGIPPGVDVAEFLDRIPAILYISETGADGRWLYVSQGVEPILGFSPREWMDDATLWARQIDPSDRERVLEREAERAEPSLPDEYRMRHRNGSTVWVRDEAALVAGDRGQLFWHGVISDITDRKLAEHELTLRGQQQAALALLGRHALEGAPLSQLINEALESLMRDDAVAGAAVLERGAPNDGLYVRARAGAWSRGELEGLAAAGPDVAASGVTGVGSPRLRSRGTITFPIATAEGHWGELLVRKASAAALEEADLDFVQTLANALSGSIARRAAEERVRHDAVHDPLTGLPNRALLLARLGEALQRPDTRIAVALLDIDNFKLINDSLGHAAGDELLTQVAPRLRRAMRPSDLIARFGGDEFVVILRGVADERAAAAVAGRIVSAFDSPFKLSAREHFAKVSVGVALVDPARSTAVSLLRDADAALYEAKNRGRARFEIFDNAMRTRTVERLAVEDDLRKALERNELHIAYQPVVSLTDGSIRSLEALLRWQHPERGAIAPDDFIPVAEESGMIGEIGRWVLETACRQSAEWQAARPDRRAVGIAVNLSPRQFIPGELEADVASILESTGVDPSTLSLEITESSLLESPEAARATIEGIGRLGVRFVLDDFGTGYSSLSYLGHLPIDGLKVDRSFVAELGINERSTAITRAVVRMAQALSLEVIAEGIESERQAVELRDLDVELAQGFLFYRPLRAERVAKLLGIGRDLLPTPRRLSRRLARESSATGA